MPRSVEVLAALLLVVATSPLLLASILISALFIGLPPFHISKRVGRNGVEYNHWKIRTMKEGEETGRVFFETDRIPPCGAVLRRLHIDELPELVLILLGKMSFVGPRPLPARLLAGLETAGRQKVRPGWTGPAQVVLLRKGKLNKRVQIRLDGVYVRRRSFGYDIRIVLATVAELFRRRRPLDLDPEASPDRARFAERVRGERPD